MPQKESEKRPKVFMANAGENFLAWILFQDKPIKFTACFCVGQKQQGAPMDKNKKSNPEKEKSKRETEELCYISPSFSFHICLSKARYHISTMKLQAMQLIQIFIPIFMNYDSKYNHLNAKINLFLH